MSGGLISLVVHYTTTYRDTCVCGFMGETCGRARKFFVECMEGGETASSHLP